MDTEPTFGSSRPRTSSEAEKSVPPIGVFTLKLRLSPRSSPVETGVVASEYSPVPGIIATARTSRHRPDPSRAGHVTSKLSCGMRLPQRSRDRFSSTT